MRLKTDENLHPEVAVDLRERGHDAVTVWDQDLRGTTDTNLAEVCLREDRALVTMDLDFSDIRAIHRINIQGSSCFGWGVKAEPMSCGRSLGLSLC